MQMYPDDQNNEQNDFNERQDVVDEEGWTQTEQLAFVRRVFYVSILIILASIGLIYLNTRLTILNSSTPFISLIVLSTILLIFSIATASWSRLESNKLVQGSNEGTDTLNSTLSRIILASGSVILVLILIASYFAILEKDQLVAYQQAKQPTPDVQIDQNKQSQFIIDAILVFNILFKIMLTLNFTVFFCVIYIIFVAFSFCNHINGLRLFIYIIGTITGIFTVLLSVQIKYISKQPQDLAAPSQELQFLLFPLAILTILIVGVLYAFNFLKYRLGYLSLGSILIVLVLIQTFVVGRIIRQSQSYQPINAGFPLVSIKDTLINRLGCTSKYYGQYTFPLPCPQSQQTTPWETSGALKACLNTNCQQLAINYFKNQSVELAITLLIISSLAFLIAAASYHLSNRYVGDKNLNYLAEGTLIVLFIIIIVVGSCLVTLKSFSVPYNAQQDQTSTLTGYPDQMECILVSQLVNSNDFRFHLNKPQCPNQDCTNQGLLVGMQGSNGKFQVPPSQQNNPGVWLYQDIVAQGAFVQDSTNIQSILVVEGLPQNLSDFFTALQFCGSQGTAQSTFTLTSQQVSLQNVITVQQSQSTIQSSGNY